MSDTRPKASGLRKKILWAAFILTDSAALLFFGALLYASLAARFNQQPVNPASIKDLAAKSARTARELIQPPPQPQAKALPPLPAKPEPAPQAAATPEAQINDIISIAQGTPIEQPQAAPQPQQQQFAPEAEPQPEPEEPAQAVPQDTPAPQPQGRKSVEIAARAGAPADKTRKVIFRYFEREADEVAVAGTFNGWKPVRLKKKGDTWETPLFLYPGKYKYYFVVDGEPVEDPFAPKAGDGLKSLADIY